MLSKIIKLEDIYNDYMKNDSKICENDYEISQFMKITIEALKDTLAGQVKLLSEIEKTNKRVKRLEQKITYYPFTEEELLKEKIGGTD